MRGLAVAAAALVLAGAGARAEVVFMSASLSPLNEVPASAGQGSGSAEIRLDTASNQLSWLITFSGLSAQVAHAHFHGPAPTTANAPIRVTIPGGGMQAGQLSGSAVLTAAQAGELLAGRWYVNLHTPTFPAGEIRGQVTRR